MKVSPVDWMLRALVGCVVVAAAIRGAGLIRFATDESMIAQDDLDARQLLGLPDDHSLRRLVVSDGAPSGAAVQGTAVLWVDTAGRVTAVVPDADGRLRISHGSTLAADMTASELSQIDYAGWAVLPPRLRRLTVFVWDADVPVYVTAGPDGQPGAAGVNDDGSGPADDLGELGATGSDDEVVAPGQPGYADAASDKSVATIINRGALVAAEGDLELPQRRSESALDADSPSQDVTAFRDPAVKAAAATEVWLEFTGEADPVRLCLQVN